MAGVRVSAVPGVEPQLGGPAVCPAEEGTPAGQVEGVRQVGEVYPIILHFLFLDWHCQTNNGWQSYVDFLVDLIMFIPYH